MWEAIAANKRRSILLILLMAGILVLLGALIGAAAIAYAGGAQARAPEFDRSAPPRLDRAPVLHGAAMGAIAAGGIFAALLLVAWAGGDAILLATAGAREIDHAAAPQLCNVVEEMRIASGLPVPPRIYIVENASPNAFAVGRNPQKASIAVTSGLLKRLNRDELQGVVAHEIGHILNQDVRFMTLAAVLMGSIVTISELFLRGMYYGSAGRRRTSRDNNGGGVAALLMIAAVLFAILAPILAQLLYFACSRRRELLADACAARFTRYPEGLASALEKIARVSGEPSPTPRAVAPLYTVNPLQRPAALTLFATHPPTDLRIKVLRSMGGGAAYADYESAFRKVAGQGPLIGGKTLESDQAVPLRDASTPSAADSRIDVREVTDLLDRIGNMLVIPCACGMRIKLPPGMRRDTLACPRCGAEHHIRPEGKKA